MLRKTLSRVRVRWLGSAPGADTIFQDGALRVSKVEGKGYGVIAVHRFEKGAHVLQEAPFARVNKNTKDAAAENPAAAVLMKRVYSLAATGTFDPSDAESWPAEVVECLERVLDIQAELVFAKLPAALQHKWMQLQFVPLALSPGGPTSTPSPGRLLRTNAFDDAQGCANLYELCARMNHSCTPNTLRLAGDNHQVKVVAARTIEAGEEVCISYLDTGTGLLLCVHVCGWFLNPTGTF
jgi:hypothetical protein